MKKRHFVILLYVYVTVSNFVFSQNREAANIIATANKEFENKNYYGAALLYKDALEKDNRMYNIVWSAAEAFRLDNDYLEAAKFYRILTDKYPDKYPRAFFYYAKMLKANEEYTKAQYFFQRYINQKNISDKELIENAKIEIINCEFARKMSNNPSGIKILQSAQNVNTVYSEFSSSLNKDFIVLFSSIQPVNEQNYEAKIYSSNINNLESLPQLFDSTINILGYDIANPFLNKDENKLYLTITETSKNGKTYIYTSDFISEKWTTPLKLSEKINYPNCNSTHPFVVERDSGNDILLWSSDKPGGEGGFDIYYCEILNNNEFGNIYNIGRPVVEDKFLQNFIDTTSVINTSGNEITPFYNVTDSTLYFSSDKYENMGGYDIFKIKGDFETWDKIENLGFPTNSSQNDFYYKIYPNNKLAFFTSNRKSSLALKHQSCCNDIYYHTIEDTVINKEDIEKEKITTITQKTKLLVPITLYFHNDIPNPNSWDTVTSLNYSTTYFEYLEMQNMYRNNFSKNLPKREKEIAIDSIDYYFSYNLQENYNKLLEFTNLMKELLLSGQKINITIKGYTSPLNTVAYNNNLAKRRISSLVNFFDEYEDGFFISYIKSGMLEYEFVAFGKTLSNSNVSDDPNDPRNSVYNPAAARERRIEIIAISVENVDKEVR